jgi:hypothetical protein
LGPETTNRAGRLALGFGVSVAVSHGLPYQFIGSGPWWFGVGGCWWWVWVWGCALFENYTVDASIFVVKLLRADGGCLGTRSR